MAKLRWIKNAEAFNAGTLTDASALGIRAVDDQTLVVELENPTPFWLDLVMTAHYAPVPREAIEAYRPWFRASLGSLRISALPEEAWPASRGRPR